MKVLYVFITGVAVYVLAVTFLLPTDTQKDSEYSAASSSLRLGSFTLAQPASGCTPTGASVGLAWTVSRNAKSYQIERFSGEGVWTRISADSLQFLDRKYLDTPTFAANTSLQYRIRAVAYNGTTSLLSNIVALTMPSCASTASSAVPPVGTSTSTGGAPTSSPTVSGKRLWGAYAGWEDSALPAFESKIGTSVNLQAVFVGWGSSGAFPTSLAAPLKAAGKTLVIFWEPSEGDTGNISQPGYSYDSIINGAWDSYIKSFAASVKGYGGPVILAPFEEMNGNWYPWSGTTNGNTPQKAVAAFQHVRTLFNDVPNAKFAWAVNSNSVPDTAANRIETYYPGDAYVDYVGLDGFNFNDSDGWITFAQTFDDPIARTKGYGKPIYILSFASAEGSKKAAWITDALTVQIPKHPEIAGWIWFNENKEKNWLVWSDSASLAAFQAAVK